MRRVHFALDIGVLKFTSFYGGLISGILLIATMPKTAHSIVREDPAGGSWITVSGLEEPMIKTSPTSEMENADLLDVIRSYEGRRRVDDFGSFERFLANHPNSGWRVAVLTDLGLGYYHYGYFSRAIECWEKAWKEGRSATDLRVKALVDRAVGELARMHARLGHANRITSLLEEIGDRPVSGPSTEAVTGARDGLWMMRNNPGVAYLCGPMALRNLLLFQKTDVASLRILDEYRSGPHGVTLAELGRLAQQLNLPYKLEYRENNGAVPVPSIVHWKVNHFAALLEEVSGRYRIQDPTFGTDLWITPEALESESSGYFLVPEQELRSGFREVSPAEATDVLGMGFTATNDQSATRPSDEKALPLCSDTPLCDYNITEMVVSVNLKDTPVGYVPAKGPRVYVNIVYNQREAGQPANFSYFNVGPKWTLSWLSYIQDDPTLPGANVSRYVAGGGYLTYFGYNSSDGLFSRETVTTVDAQLHRVSDGAYHRLLPDGAREIYSQSDGATAFPRRIFLTQIIDPAGNTVTLHYDSQVRLTSITDATGRDTMFSYELGSNPLLVTKITDPFGRSAHITYDVGGHLYRITDVGGLSSEFGYNASGLVTSMTTPYGTTTFSFGTGTGYGPSRFVEVTDPMGNSERVEYLQGAPGIASEESPVPVGITPFNYQGSMFMNGRNTFYWDKQALQIARGDYTNARIRHWLHDATDPTGTTTSCVVESVKYPLERRIWRNYPGECGGGSTGDLDKPSIVARVLDDGSTQSSQFTYNSLGKPLTMIDPMGRETLYDYDSTNYDLVRIRQRTCQSQFAQLATFTYNNQHSPLTYTDAAGQVTIYDYNTAGQLTKVTNALRQTTSYVYNDLGQLTQSIGPDKSVELELAYDAYGRVHTSTDVKGFTRTYSYDSLDRVTRISYPDGTSDKFSYTNLDLAESKDRLNHVTHYYYNAIRQLVRVTDPLGRSLRYDYCACGSISGLTDAKGRVTQWLRDIENRVVAKMYNDNSTVTYNYDLAGRITSIRDAKNQRTSYKYYTDNALSAVEYSTPTLGVKFAYDDFRRLSSMTDQTGTTTYSYLAVGQRGALRLASQQSPSLYGTITYGYDELGRIVSRAIDGVSVTWQYDSLGRLATASNQLGQFVYSYLGSSSLLTEVDEPNGQDLTYQYYGPEGSLRLQQIVQHSPAGTGIHVFQYDALGNITQWRQQNLAGDAAVWFVRYDDDNQLKSVRIARTGLKTEDQHYKFDAAENLCELIRSTSLSKYTVNDLNQLLRVESQDVGRTDQMSYDANGNQTSRVSGSTIDYTNRKYHWDAANRLIQIDYLEPKSDNISGSSVLTYDGFGRLAKIVENDGAVMGSNRIFVWAGNEMIQERDGQGNIVEAFFPQGFQLIRDTAAVGAGGFYYARDHLGSIRNITRRDGRTEVEFAYGPFGEGPLRATGGAASANPGNNVDVYNFDAVLTNFGYTGLFFHQRSGLNFALDRVYDPVLKRWLSRDPFPDSEVTVGPNVYSYVGNRPLSFIDPFGFCGAAPKSGEPSPSPSDQPSAPDDTTIEEQTAWLALALAIPGHAWNALKTYATNILNKGGSNIDTIVGPPSDTPTSIPETPSPRPTQ